MQITEIKIAGFKSFVDPVTFYVEPGLTGIVGPNGCGKSNLLESLRWVMGASSARAMRGGEMDDLIFSGTEKRPARETAEVTLVLDNTDRRAPPEFNDMERLEVLRKLRRGVGSTYKINGKTVRGKDIQLLFADASTGANSPALVRQGQISELIGSKPQNRRRLLEEAAGIAGLNTRRHEAELKLRGAENNLERLSEVSSEVERQLGSLKRQASKARKHKAISERVNSLEALIAHRRWSNAQRVLEDAKAALAKSREDVEKLTLEDAITERKALEAREKIEPLRAAEAEAAARVGQAKVRLTQLQGEKREADSAVTRYTSDLERIVSDVSREQGLTEDAEARLEEAQYALSNLPSLDPEAFERDQQEAMARLQMIQKDLKDAEQIAQSHTETLARIRAEREATERQRRDLEQRLNAAQNRLNQLDAEMARLPDTTALEAEAEQAKAALERAETKLEESAAAITAREDELGDLRKAEDAANQPLQEADSKLRTLKAEITGLERLLRKAESSSAPPVLDALSPAPGYERALAAALGDDLNAPLDPSAPAFWGGATTLSDPALPSGCQSLADVCEAPAELSRRLAQCGVVETDGDAAALVSALQVGQRIISKAGGLWRWDGYVRKSDAPLSQAEQLEQRNRLDAARKAVPELEAELSAAQARKTECQSARQTAETDLRQLRQQAPLLQKARNEANNQVFRTEQALERASLKRDSLSETVETARSQRDEAKTAFDALPGADEADDTDRIAGELAEIRNRISGLRSDETNARSALSDLQRNRERLEGRRRGLERDIRDWSKRLEQSRQRIGELHANRTSTRDALEASKDQPEKIQDQIDALAFDLKSLEAKRQEAADTHAAAEGESRAAEAQARAAKDAASKAREDGAMASAQLETAKERLRDAEELASSQFQRQPQGLLTLAESFLEEDWLEANTKAVDQELAIQKNELMSLGAVNQDAEREAEELAERLGAQHTEKADLTAAIAKLREGVDALNEEGRDRLLAAFETVNEHFQSLFTALFNGGQAELKLVDADDPLMAGLEIFAQPPGKKVTSLNLMSGGEQALTATALIFAVFLSNPAPICVLDEVDAPLDDVNVDRFCRLLDEMRRRTSTRFVAITHNPVTMSRMDRLFGVTMQERGVSRIVSVDLGTAEQLVAAE
ncbi:chromosome segregation protein SMC [Ponticaulis profundi]|uniref:Chromosome partition protein Smc n=1 Tax=Ponticaulis profundi TaxID=2665222 RepID=A0ABW1S7R8_9PROT